MGKKKKKPKTTATKKAGKAAPKPAHAIAFNELTPALLERLGPSAAPMVPELTITPGGKGNG